MEIQDEQKVDLTWVAQYRLSQSRRPNSENRINRKPIYELKEYPLSIRLITCL